MRLDAAEQLRRQGKLDRAITICESLVRRYPDYWAAQHTLGLICAEKNNYQRALDCLVRAAMINPASWTTLTALSGVYLRLGFEKMASQTLEQARQINPHDANILCTLGEIYRAEHEFELAIDSYRQALAVEPGLVLAEMGLGSCFAEIGENESAAQSFEKPLKRGVKLLETLYELSGLPRSVVTVDILTELDALPEYQGRNREEFENTFAFTKAAALDSVGRFSEAWRQLTKVNQRLHLTKRKEIEGFHEKFRTSLASLRNSAGEIAPADEAIPISLFILGPSRSGKTTLERLAGFLQGVKRGYENPIVRNSIRRTFQAAGLLTSSFLEHLPLQLFQACRDVYREELVQRAGTSQIITNTNPAIISDAARMIALFPNLRFVLVKRNLDDNLLRVYMREYEKGNVYAYDLKSIRDYLLWYEQMIDALAEKFPTLTRVVKYEDMLDDPAAAVDFVAGLCGLSPGQVTLPETGDDRNCALPYREFLAAGLAD